jgi:hypothetical protein
MGIAHAKLAVLNRLWDLDSTRVWHTMDSAASSKNSCWDWSVAKLAMLILSGRTTSTMCVDRIAFGACFVALAVALQNFQSPKFWLSSARGYGVVASSVALAHSAEAISHLHSSALA